MSLQTTTLGRTNLNVTQIGFGGYRIDDRIEDHEKALTLALKNGINLIDTSTNYNDGHSEILIGNVLKKESAREKVTLVTKAGYIQGSTLQHVIEKEKQGSSYPDVVDCDTTLRHCIHPDFLLHQIQKSLQRLQTHKLDIFLIHNPEYYLIWAENNEIDHQEAIKNYYQRLSNAFEFLEDQVKRGNISHYGVSSNTFIKAKTTYTFTSLSTLWKIAESLSPNHHFSVIQCPANLLEGHAFTEENQPQDLTAIDFARAHNIGVLVNRPFNAIKDENLCRLVEFHNNEPVSQATIEDYLQELLSQENEFNEGISEQIILDNPEHRSQLNQLFCIGEQLHSHWHTCNGYFHWKDVLSLALLPNLEYAVTLLSQFPQPDPIQLWLQLYIQRVNTIAKFISAYYSEDHNQRVHSIKKIAQELDTSLQKLETLNQIALRALRQTEGVSCILVGMKHIEYVNQITGELKTTIQQTPNKEFWQNLSERFYNRDDG